MRTDSKARAIRRGLVLLVVVLVCLTGCQGNGSKVASTNGHDDGSCAARDLRVDKSVCSLRTHQLNPQMIRIYWAGESSFAVDGKVQLNSRPSLVRYLSRQDRSHLEHGILLVSAKPGPGFDPLDALSRFCSRHNVNLYCVALVNSEPDEPAVQDVAAASDWRADLPGVVHWVVQASPCGPGELRQAAAKDPCVRTGPVAVR